MHDLALRLVERVLPDVPIRQYVLSPPSELVGLLGARTEPLSALARVFVRCMFDAIGRRVDAGVAAYPGAVVVMQRLSKTLALFPHLHVLALDGAYVEVGDELEFRVDPGPTPDDLLDLEDEVERRFSRWLEQHGYLEEDDQDEEALDGWFGPAAYDTVQGHRPPAKPRDPNRFSGARPCSRRSR